MPRKGKKRWVTRRRVVNRTIKVKKGQRQAVIVVGRSGHKDWGYGADGRRMKKMLQMARYDTTLVSADLNHEEWAEEWDAAFRKRNKGHFATLPPPDTKTEDLRALRRNPPRARTTRDKFIICLFDHGLIQSESGSMLLDDATHDMLETRQLHNWIKDLVGQGWRVGLFVVCCHAPEMVTQSTIKLLDACKGFAVISDSSNVGSQENYYTDKMKDIRYGTCLLYRLFTSLAKVPLNKVLDSVRGDYDREKELPATPKFINPENFSKFFGPADHVLHQPTDIPLVPLKDLRHAKHFSGVPGHSNSNWPVLDNLVEFAIKVDSLGETKERVTQMYQQLVQDNGPFFPEHKRGDVVHMFEWMKSKSLVTYDFHGGFYPTAFVMCNWTIAELKRVAP
eukprot:TRINITY_DN63122_c0_g2_i1.p1 TRINITY_DN63122_c0_g2~~TRINITY_DN63122_c0_g2_i1.p1  ORF type:complete len:393 (-),score=31.67 TRINITY_DN63122_c0_g2_i1:117-1295(-)